MTSEEIKKIGPGGCDPGLLDIAAFLQEIAYQLAVLNERQIPDVTAQVAYADLIKSWGDDAHQQILKGML